MKNSARGFSSLILILLVVVLVAGGAYFFLNQENAVNGNSAQQTASASYAVSTGYTGDLSSLFSSFTNWFQFHSSSTPVNILPVPLGYTETHYGIAARLQSNICKN